MMQTNNNDRWGSLSMQERAQLLGIYASKGYTDLAKIISHYNSFATGGIVDDPPVDPVLKGRQPRANFHQRLLNPFRQTIPDWENRINGTNRVATHKLSWATDANGNAIVYPEVQEINSKLYDFTDPRNKESKSAAIDRAIETGDTIMMTPAQANFWTQHYKEFYPSFNYATGGHLQDRGPDDPEEDKIYTAHPLNEVQIISQRNPVQVDTLQQHLDNVNSFYYNDVVPRLQREHQGLKTKPDINFPYLHIEDVDFNPIWLGKGKPDAYVNPIFPSKVHSYITPEVGYFDEVMTHENSHRWQFEYPKRDRQYKDKSKEMLRQAYGNATNKFRNTYKSYPAFVVYGPNRTMINNEYEADNRAVRYNIWREYRDLYHRTPTIEELDKYIDEMPEDRLYKYFIKPSGYLDVLSAIPKFGDRNFNDELEYFNENMKAVKEALKHVAQNNTTEDTVHYAATGGHLYQDGGPDDDKAFVSSQASETGWMPEVYITADRPEWQKGLTNYDWNRARRYYGDENGHITSEGFTFLKNIASKNRTGKSNFMRDVDRLAAIPNAAVGAIGAIPAAAGLIAATTNPVVDALLTAQAITTAPKNIKEGIQNIQEGNTWQGIGDLGLTALDFLGAGQLVGRASRMLNKGYRAKHAYNTIMPASYDNPIQRGKEWVRDMWYNEPVDMKTPKWFKQTKTQRDLADSSKMPYEQAKMTGYTNTAGYITPGTENAAKIADEARLDAWAIYNGLEPQYGTYIKNADGTYSYDLARIRRISNNTWDPAYTPDNIPFDIKLSAGNGQDFVTGAGGGLTDFRILGTDTHGNGIMRIEDVWDLHPFSRSSDVLSQRIQKKLFPNWEEKFANPMFEKASRVLDWGLSHNSKRIENLGNKMFDASDKPLFGLLEKIDDKMKNFEVGKLTGGKPFKMSTDIKYHLEDPLLSRLETDELGNISFNSGKRVLHYGFTPDYIANIKPIEKDLYNAYDLGDLKDMLKNITKVKYIHATGGHLYQDGGSLLGFNKAKRLAKNGKTYEERVRGSEDAMLAAWTGGLNYFNEKAVLDGFKNKNDALQQAGPLQNSFLLSGIDKDRYMLDHGYIKVNTDDYGLVKKKVGNKNFPIYQTQPDDIDRKYLVPIGNPFNNDSFLGHNLSWFGQKMATLQHAGNYPSTLYVDGRNPSNMYQKAWDLNDYSSNLLNWMGYPAVQTTGYSYVPYTRKFYYDDIYKIKGPESYFDDYLKEHGLTREVIDGKEYYMHEPVVITESRKKELGGSLGYITPLGQWQYPHQVTTIPSNNITMKGVNYPVIGVSDTGDTKYMLPNMDYLFDGNYVTEYPVHKFQDGGPDDDKYSFLRREPEVAVADNTRYVRPITDVEIDRTSGLPEGTTTMRRIIAAQADRQQPVIKQDTATSETHKSINKEVKKAQTAKKVNDVANAVAAVTSIPATIVAPEVMTPIFALQGFNDATDVLSKEGNLNTEDYGRLGLDALFMLPMFNTAGNYLRFNTNLGRSIELSRALNKSIRNTELSQRVVENPSNNRFRLGDVEINDPNLMYRQTDSRALGEVASGGNRHTMFNRGSLWYGIPTESMLNPIIEPKQIGKLKLTKPNSEVAKTHLLVTRNAEMTGANQKFGRISIGPHSDSSLHLNIEKSPEDRWLNEMIREWRNKNSESDVVTYVTDGGSRRLPLEGALNNSNTSIYIFDPGYGYRRIQEPIPTLEQAYQEDMIEKYPLALSHDISNNYLKSTLLGRHKSLLNPSMGLGHLKYNSEIDNHTALIFGKDMLNSSHTPYLGDGNTPMVYEFFDDNEPISRYSARKINQRMRSKSGTPLSKLGAGEQISLDDAIRIARENVAKGDNFNTYNELKFDGLIPVKKAGYGFTDSEEIADMLQRRGIITNFDFYTSDPSAYSNYEDFLKNVVFKNPDYKFKKGGKLK